jgi:hypothetical protein
MGMMRKSLWSGLLLGTALCVAANAGVASAQTAGQDMHNAGHETANAAKDTGNGVKRGTSTAYHKTSNGTKKAYHSTAHGTKKAYHKTGRGVSKVGDKMEGRPGPQ